MFILKYFSLLFTLLVTMISFNSNAGDLLTQFPDTVDPNSKYVFYSHGFIVEGTNPEPVHPLFGVYRFPDIKKALSASKFNLIAYHRPKGSTPQKSAERLVNDVKKLMKMGVKAKNITLLGFSRGGMITALASSLLSTPDLNTILMAACGRWLDNNSEIKLTGHVLSIYEKSDSFGSCQSVNQRSENIQSFKEVMINTGKKHGAFFTPRSEWIDPVVMWINTK